MLTRRILSRCCVIGIVRFMYLHEIDLLGNLTGTSQNTFILLTVELVLAVLCINIPTLRPYYIRFRAKYGSFWSSGAAYGASGTAGSGTKRSYVPSASGRRGTAAETLFEEDGRRHNEQSGVPASSSATGSRMTSSNVVKKGDSGDYAAWIELVSCY